MGIREKFGAWLLKGVWTVDQDLMFGNGDFPDIPFHTLSKEGYEHVATVFRAVNLVAKTAATVMFGVFEEGDEGDELIPKHPFISSLRRPNPLMGRATFIKFWVTSMLLGGRAFIWANKSETTGELLELWALPPADVQVHWGEIFGTVTHFTWTHEGSHFRLEAEDVLMTWFPNPRNILEAMPPLQAAAKEVDLSNEGLIWNLSLLVNSAKPPFYVALPKDSEQVLKDTQVDEIKKALAEEHQGSRRVGKPVVFKTPGLQLVPYGWNPQDIDWLKGLEMADVRIANVFDVPPELVGAQKTYENFKEAVRALYDQAVIPLMELLADELTNWKLLGFEDNEFIGILREKIRALQEDQDAIAARVVNLVNTGVITRNEGRMDLKKKKSDDPMADELTVAKEVVPLGTAGLNLGTESLEEERNRRG